MNSKITITIKYYGEEYEISTPSDGAIDEPLKATMFLLEMAGWHRNTIEGWILETAEEINNNNKND